MTYQTLYRKYRSQTFADLVGQEATRRALQGAIGGDRVTHAYLFAGTRGTGKTSAARLLAKAVNCLQRACGSAEPCTRCESCRQIQNGTALDLIEIDAASNRGIDEIRDLREKVNLAPALGRRKIYIIDEAHMLTTEAFNALLKTLEEPPPHVVFVLCTTEANKVPATVVGRCQQFNFRRFNDEQITGRLQHVAQLEGIQVEPAALSLMAKVAQGSMRDAIGLLDQLVPLAGETITGTAARDLLGLADPRQVERIFDLVLAGRASEALTELARVYEAGGELRQLVRGLMERCRDLLLLAIERREEGRRAWLSSALDSLLHLDGEVRRHGEPRFLVEAALVRLAANAAPGDSQATGGVAVGVEQVTEVVAQSETATPTDFPPLPAPAAISEPVPVAGAPPPRDTAPPAPAGSPAPAPQSAPAPVGASSSSDSVEGWRGVLEQLSPKMKAYFRDAQPAVSGSRLSLTFAYAFHHKMAQENAGEIAPPVSAWLGEGATVEFLLQDAKAPAMRTAAATAAQSPEDDPLVKAAIRELEGKVLRVKQMPGPRAGSKSEL
ncbi:MAG: DNA polymerase III subunit gamma/tau [Candidatus Dormibacteraeota bacterium]|uniref:DNA polymerase III subunit gamma/tau n=1 Tax=Candidatus Dormiibacter inghamiae TaxID=3127013 RepID=A0A934KGQ8_9BACT|nr:DNA polymerase III subunit gamma/tau [Candidatus Dormibacteraeota bacterium]MBJ7604862.1 DNA polymerase III subunit gamma/tau [Candidatus Dormibacteraeota bacterium]